MLDTVYLGGWIFTCMDACCLMDGVAYLICLTPPSFHTSLSTLCTSCPASTPPTPSTLHTSSLTPIQVVSGPSSWTTRMPSEALHRLPHWGALVGVCPHWGCVLTGGVFSQGVCSHWAVSSLGREGLIS